MAGRAPPPNLRQPTSRTTRAATATTGGGVRRNLFTSQLTRRPTSSADANAPGTALTPSSNPPHTTFLSSNPAETVCLDPQALSDASEIVIRDQNGEFEVGDPPTPPLDDAEEDPALDDAQENERERRKLAELVRQHQMSTRIPAQPEEVLEALRASMRAKVAALTDDNWMYEAEELAPVR
ncbi:hypothetical protein F5Y18DRAFT_299921 [Xylariaceae sp. FL1019]|nr:hypothetical protein F5Y18DRAFT_299921 [Xylariaceae sp. FL1019]